jgi:hypothetical protein
VSALFAISFQLVASMGLAKHMPTKMTVMPSRPTIERGSLAIPGRETPGTQAAARGEGRTAGVDGIIVRRAAQTSFEPFPAKIIPGKPSDAPLRIPSEAVKSD